MGHHNRLAFRALALTLAVCVSSCSMMGSTKQRDSIANQIDQAPIGRHAIGVEVRSGVAILDGTVASDSARRTVEEIATNTPGIDRVESSLIVQADSANGQSELARTVWKNLKAHDMIGTYQISILAQAGIVTLTGTAGSESTRQSIEQIAQATQGVNRVENRIQVLR